jgi:hypothetical protein
MAGTKTSIRFVIISGIAWICFGVFGLFEAPERPLVTIAQFAAGVIHFGYAYLAWRHFRADQSQS